jgi:hypothetical protein
VPENILNCLVNEDLYGKSYSFRDLEFKDTDTLEYGNCGLVIIRACSVGELQAFKRQL